MIVFTPIHKRIQKTLYQKIDMLKKNWVGNHLINEPVVVPTQDGSQPEPNENYMFARSTWTRATSFVPLKGNKPVILMGGEMDWRGNLVGDFDTTKLWETTDYDLLHDRGAKYVGQPGGDHQMPFRPLPGIKDISIEYKGGGMTLGATRTAEINWTCWTWEELDRLMQHFLAHGKTVFLEWGWAGNTTSLKDAKPYPLFTTDEWEGEGELIFNNDEIKTDSNGKSLSDKIPEYILQQNGHYDAMLGVIQNFTWSVRDDGGFDCVTTLVSPGMSALTKHFKSSGNENMSTLPLLVEEGANLSNIAYNKYGGALIQMKTDTLEGTLGEPKMSREMMSKQGKNWKDKLVIQGSGADIENEIYAGKIEMIGDRPYFKRKYPNLEIPSEYFRRFAPYFNFRNFIADLPDQLKNNWTLNKNSRESGAIIRILPFKLTVDGEERDILPGNYKWKMGESIGKVSRSYYYCTWGWFEDNVLSRFFSNITIDSKVQGIFRSLDYKYDEDTGEVLKETTDGAGNKIAAYPQSVKIRDTRKLYTTDTTKWLLIKDDVLSEEIKKNVYYGKKGGFLGYDQDGAPGVEGQDPPLWKFSPKAEQFDKYGVCNRNEGFLRNVYFHCNFLTDKMMGSSTIQEAVMSVWDEFAAEYGGVHRFKITFEDDGNHIVIRDTGQQGDTVINLIENGKTNRRKDDDSDGDMNGLFEFPIWEDGSIVKSQNLNAKLPDRMQIAAMYGSHNVDTSENESQRDNDVLAGMAWGKLFSPDDDDDDEQTLEKMKNKNYQDLIGGKVDLPSKLNRSFGRADANPVVGLHVGDGTGNLETPVDGTIVYPSIFHEIFAQQSLELQRRVKMKLEGTGESEDERPWYKKMFAAETVFDKENKLEEARKKWASMNSLDSDIDIYEFVEQEASSISMDIGGGGTTTAATGTLKIRSEFSALMKSYFRGDVDGISNKTDPLVPVELEIDIDGTGGIFPGNAFQSSYLPQRYRDVACFQVVGASHKVDPSGWTTTIKGQIRVGLREEELIGPDIPSTSEWYDSKSEEEKTEYKIDVGAPDAFDGTPTTIIIPAGTPEGEEEEIVIQPTTTPEEMEEWEDERDLKAYNEVTPGTDEYKEITERYIRNIRRDDDHWEADNLLSWVNTADSSGKGTGNEFLSYMMANQKNTSIFPQEWFSGDHHEIGIGYNNWLDSISINTPGD
jgi:hypothetical protein